MVVCLKLQHNLHLFFLQQVTCPVRTDQQTAREATKANQQQYPCYKGRTGHVAETVEGPL